VHSRRCLAIVITVAFAFSAPAADDLPLLPHPFQQEVVGPSLRPVATQAERPLWIMATVRSETGQLWARNTAVSPKGKRLGVFDGALTPAWSQDGRRYAFAWGSSRSYIDLGGGVIDFNYRLSIVTVGGNQQSFTLGTGRRIAPWQIAWSPDGSQLAFVASAAVSTQDPTTSPAPQVLIILKSAWTRNENPVVAEYPLPDATAGAAARQGPPDKLRWSPDGQRVLVSWGNVLTVDVRDGRTTLIHGQPAAAAWTPRGDGIIYLTTHQPATAGLGSWGSVFLRHLVGGEPLVVLDSVRLAELGLHKIGLNNGVLDFSPDGRLLALAGGDGFASGVVQQFALAEDGSVHWGRPIRSYAGLGAIAGFDWAPDSSGFAVVTVPATAPPTKNAPTSFEVVTSIYPNVGEPKVLGRIKLPRQSGYVNYVSSIRMLSWSH
jgi:hypothetical protein